MGDDKIRREDAPKGDAVHEQGSSNSGEMTKLTSQSDYKGTLEKERLAAGRELFTPLTLQGPDIYRATGLGAFRTQYEIYKIPVHHTQRALGRVNDLVDAGAPRTPAEIDAQTAKKFKKLSTTDQKDATKQNSANQWIEQQEEMESDFASYMNARESLQGAVLKFRSAQEILRRRALEAKKAGKESEKAKIDKAADTLVQIVDTAIMAGSAMSALEKGFLSSGAAGEEYTDADVYNDVAGQPKIASATTKKTGAGKKAYELAKEHAGKLNLKNIFIFAMGDGAKYQQLMADIIKLNGEIADAQLKTEDLQIEAAKVDLDNVQVSISDRRGALEGKRATTRDAAQTFGQAMGGKHKTIAVAMMAEAYQELELFGNRALEEGIQLHPSAMSVWRWLSNHEERYKVMRRDPFDGFANDVNELVPAIRDTEKTTTLLKTEVPIWNQTARTWKNFLSDVTGKTFDKDDVSESRPPT